MIRQETNITRTTNVTNGQVTILIVEDHDVTLRGLMSELGACSDFHVVGTAKAYKEGLDLARQLKPDIILLDLHLPDSKGPKALVQAFCAVTGSKVVVFSGESRMAFIEIVLQMGVAGYLLKSENLESVAESIRRIASGERLVISQDLSSGQVKLTRVEKELLAMLARGWKYHDIAEQRTTSWTTVRRQCEILMSKLELETREELIAWAVSNGYASIELDL